MLSRWQWLLRQFGRKLSVRVTVFTLVAIFTALIGTLAAPWIPADIPARVGADSLDNILGILASSMLAVTTFSLTTMVTAYTAATSNATPRSSQLLMHDPTTQNTLGTFIGSFVFSLVGIVLLSTGAYGETGRLVLFVATIGVIVLIIVTLLRWIDYLSRVARVFETTDKVEHEAHKALSDRVARPFLGCRPLRDPKCDVPADAAPVYGRAIGYLQHLDVEALDDLAGKHGARVFVLALPGTFIDPSRPLARVDGSGEAELHESIVDAFTIGDQRSFDQDPRFGLCVLAEIASRALSPGINDSGTAIDVIGSGLRILADWAPDSHASGGNETAGDDAVCPNVFVPPIATADLFDDFFRPIARDGAAKVEIQIRLQKALHALAQLGGEEMRENARRHAVLALAHAEAALILDAEKQSVRDLAARLAPGSAGLRSTVA